MTDLRTDSAAFARRVLGLGLWPHQIEVIEDRTFIRALAKARRTGGTVTAGVESIHTAFAHPGCRTIVLSATQDAARRLTEWIGERLGRSKLTRGAVVDAHATRIRLTNGSEIVSLPASQRQVRGYGENVLLVVLDEAGFMASELWTAAHYVALDERANGSRILMIGTPWGGPEHFFRRAFEAGRDGDPDHSAHHWTFEANPRLDHAYLARMRDRVSPAEYEAEVLGEWSEAQGSLIPRAVIEAATADFEVPGLDGLRPPARALLGLDWGVSFDRSAAVAISRLPVAMLNPGRIERPTFCVSAVEVWPAGALLDEVVSAVVASPGEWAVISPEVSGVGAGPTQELRRRFGKKLAVLKAQARHDGNPGPAKLVWNEVATTAQKKTIGYGWIRHLLEQGRLVLPRHPDLLRQLAGLRFEIGERGFMRIEADSPAMHDDVADALMLAAGPHTRGGRATCTLARCAASPVADAAVPSADVVETGGGLVVPRLPALQDLYGEAVTMPPKRAADPLAAIREQFQRARETRAEEATDGNR